MERQNVTLALPKELLRKAKRMAIERQLSLSGLMLQLLTDAVRHEEEYEQARRRSVERMQRGYDLGTNGVIPGRARTCMSANNLREFVDANILIYAHDTTAGEKYRRAMTLLEGLWASQLGCVSIQILQEFFVNVTRKLARPLTVERAAELIADFATWPVHSPDAHDLLAAITIQRRYNLSFWDAMVVQSASQLGCAILWSEDLNAGQNYAGVRVLNPFE